MFRFRILLVSLVVAMLAALVSYPQYYTSKVTPPPPPPPAGQNQYLEGTHIPDSSFLPSPVSPTLPRGYSDYMGQEYAADLSDPSNIRTEAVYDPSTGLYVIHTKVGDRDIVTPYMMTAEEYHDLVNRQELFSYFKQRNAETFENKDKEPFNILDMNFALGPLDKVFGPGGVRLTTQGSIQLSMGIKSNRTDNPALSLKSRRKTFFDFDQKIQATIGASVGDKLKFNMTYNTDATFDFDSKNLRLNYEGKEDEIIKNIEAGNVSMSTGSSLIRAVHLFSVSKPNCSLAN